jgi:4-carboxymuconolactone decarboxylase
MARVKLIVSRDDIAVEHHALFDELAALRGRISGPSTVVLHSPGLARPWNEIGEFLHRHSIVEPPHAELAVCTTAREKDCGYIWNAHVPLARKAGVPAATLDLVRDRRGVIGMSGPEMAVVQYVRQLIQTNRVEPHVFDPLLQAHGPQWLVELTVWIGRYQALAGILNGFDVRATMAVEELPDVPRAATTAPARGLRATPRVAPITRREQVADPHRPVFDAVAEGRGSVRGPFSILMYSPVLCRRHLDVGTFLRFNSRLEGDSRELAVIATAREKDCPYIWAAHAPAARQAGISNAVVAIVRDRGELAGLPAAERDIVDYTRQLIRNNTVAPVLFDRLQGRHGVPWLVELTCLIGHYGIVASLLNAFEVAPAPDAEPLPLAGGQKGP